MQKELLRVKVTIFSYNPPEVNIEGKVETKFPFPKFYPSHYTAIFF
jgi:hypothetical protein